MYGKTGQDHRAPNPAGQGCPRYPAKRALRPLCALIGLWMLLGMASPALAHRVHLFAYVNGNEIVADCRFSKTRPAQNAAVIAYDAASGQELFRGASDSTGTARLTIPPEILRHPVNLKLILNAGEGHQAEWLIEAEALQPQSAPSENNSPPAESAPEKTDTTEQTDSLPDAAAVSQSRTADQAGCSSAELEALLNRALDAKLAPVQALLAAQLAASQAKGPGFTEIVGGLGWLAGLFGGLAFWKSRKQRQESR